MRTAHERGQVLPVVMICLVVLTIIIAGLVKWEQYDATSTSDQQKNTSAINLAEAGIDRGIWKLQMATYTFANAANGVVVSGYNFDQTYKDNPSGTYRVKFTAGPLPLEVTITAEGRDNLKHETRAIQVVEKNVAVAGAIITGGVLADSGQAIVHWGAEMAMNNITVSGSSLSNHYPRKLSHQTVVPYDANGITPPNTDNLEWWSAYDVPDLPVLDFVALRSSAAATGTLNCNGNACSSGSCTSNNHATGVNIPCNSACTNCTVSNFYQDPRYNQNYIWYWDNNVTIDEPGVKGTFIIRKNLTTTNEDWYGPYGPLNTTVTMDVPDNAWIEYQKIDTSASNQYPGDLALHSSAATYTLGSCSAACEGSSSGDDLGFYGFLYVGGNVNFSGAADIYGAVWVVGSWTATGNNMVFYNDNLVLPTLNVSLIRQSWQEVGASVTAWAP